MVSQPGCLPQAEGRSIDTLAVVDDDGPVLAEGATGEEARRERTCLRSMTDAVSRTASSY